MTINTSSTLYPHFIHTCDHASLMIDFICSGSVSFIGGR
jgi:hypothetical protein